MTLNCLIVDDEPLALDLLESYVSRTPFLHLVAQCDSAVKALSVIEEEPIDLVFLDIQMPELNGLELSRLVGNKVKIIFTTAFEQYALEGFRVDALDYLLKPFNYTEFLLVTSCRLCTSHITAHRNLISAFFQIRQIDLPIRGITDRKAVLCAAADIDQLQRLADDRISLPVIRVHI